MKISKLTMAPLKLRKGLEKRSYERTMQRDADTGGDFDNHDRSDFAGRRLLCGGREQRAGHIGRFVLGGGSRLFRFSLA
jgi:hypothetical protein